MFEPHREDDPGETPRTERLLCVDANGERGDGVTFLRVNFCGKWGMSVYFVANRSCQLVRLGANLSRDRQAPMKRVLPLW